MRRVESSLVIPVPAERVFAFIEDVRNLPRWQEGVELAERTSDGPVRVGSTARIRRQLLGQPLTVDLRVVEHEAPTHLGLETSAQGLRVLATLDLLPSPSGTKVTFGMALEGRGFASFVEPMVARAAEKELPDSLKRLRAALA
ncbi:MAG TPA: SRPBCC family protein [Candidatus Limnocylindria bacterium]|nr:SRPBCC family protein [Candidatus Limnocylindria bacterium]